jgi:hypothetical protein
MNALAKRLPGTGTVSFHGASATWRIRTPGQLGTQHGGFQTREAAERALEAAAPERGDATAPGASSAAKPRGRHSAAAVRNLTRALATILRRSSRSAADFCCIPQGLHGFMMHLPSMPNVNVVHPGILFSPASEGRPSSSDGVFASAAEGGPRLNDVFLQ